MASRRWLDLSSPQRRVIVAAGTVEVVLLGAALRDLARRPGEQVRGPKPAWAAASFVNIVGPAAYFLFGRRPRR
ncbi:MAG: PLDc_N domain-containing protein [Acidothermales bacterium]|jgi:hypothetical protein|nr:PLDc_N domain-containing protein [Acidothermales bacterium]